MRRMLPLAATWSHYLTASVLALHVKGQRLPIPPRLCQRKYSIMVTQAPHLGILPVTVELLEHMFCLPQGYSIVGVNYDAFHRTINFTLQSDDLPKSHEYRELPRLTIIIKVETWPDAPPEYRKITTEVKIP